MNTIASPRRSLAAAIVSLTALAAAATTHAAVFVVSEAQLSPPVVSAAGIVHFDEVANGTAINGVTIKGFSFSENIPVAFTSAGGGPGNTNHIDGSMALQTGPGYNSATYRLTIQMPGSSTSFGFGFAILSGATPNAVTITLFDGATNVGAITYPGVLDPTFAGGFAGIGSTIAFNSAQVTFGPSAVSFALDNMAAVAGGPVAAVPEPGSALVGMLALGLCGLGTARRRA